MGQIGQFATFDHQNSLPVSGHSVRAANDPVQYLAVGKNRPSNVLHTTIIHRASGLTPSALAMVAGSCAPIDGGGYLPDRTVADL